MRTGTFPLLVVFGVAMCAMATSDDGWNLIPNVTNNRNIQGLGQCAMSEFANQSGEHAEYVGVVRASRRGEMTYKLVVYAKERGAEPRCFNFVVFNFDQDLPQYCRLLSYAECN